MDEELLTPAYKSIVDILAVLDGFGDDILKIFNETQERINGIWKLKKKN